MTTLAVRTPLMSPPGAGLVRTLVRVLMLAVMVAACGASAAAAPTAADFPRELEAFQAAVNAELGGIKPETRIYEYHAMCARLADSASAFVAMLDDVTFPDAVRADVSLVRMAAEDFGERSTACTTFDDAAGLEPAIKSQMAAWVALAMWGRRLEMSLGVPVPTPRV